MEKLESRLSIMFHHRPPVRRIRRNKQHSASQRLQIVSQLPQAIERCIALREDDHTQGRADQREWPMPHLAAGTPPLERDRPLVAALAMGRPTAGAIGLAVYFAYSRRRSHMREGGGAIVPD